MEVLDELKLKVAALPAPGPNERTRRAIFFATALGFDCIELLSSFKVSFQKSSKGTGNSTAKLEFDSAVKELIGLNLYLTSLDLCGGEPDSWLVKFILDALVASDKLNPLPPAQEVLKHYEQYGNASDACAAAAARIYAQLCPSESNSPAANALQDLLSRDADKRRILLKTALFEPFETLDKTVQSRLAKGKHS